MVVSKSTEELRPEICKIFSRNHAYYITAKKIGLNAEQHTQVGVSVEKGYFEDHLPTEDAIDAVLQLFDQELVKRVEEAELKAKVEFAYFTRDNATLEDVQWLDKRIAEMKEELATLNNQSKETE